MPKDMRALLGVGICVCLIAGCTGSAGVSARSYLADQERVDQDMSDDGNNYGYIYGDPSPEDRSEYKKTRQVYVVEFTKEADEKVGDVIVLPARERPVSLPPVDRRRRDPDPEQLVIPDFDDAMIDEDPVVMETNYVDYTVQKNDTLQKISKKHYDTYRRWQEIFEANTDVMADPNKLKPGMTLRIPVDQ